MSNSKRRKRPHNQNYFTCMNKGCNSIFFTSNLLLEHYKTKKQCFIYNTFNCNNCSLPFISHKGLQIQFSKNPECQYSNQLNKDIQFGKIPNINFFQINPHINLSKTCNISSSNNTLLNYTLPTKDHPKTLLTISSHHIDNLISNSNHPRNIICSSSNLLQHQTIFNEASSTPYNNSQLTNNDSILLTHDNNSTLSNTPDIHNDNVSINNNIHSTDNDNESNSSDSLLSHINNSIDVTNIQKEISSFKNNTILEP